MEFTITTQEREQVQLFPITVPDDSPIAIPGARGIEALVRAGSMRFYAVECPRFIIWYNNYQISSRTFIRKIMDAPLLALHFTLSNTMHYKLEGLTEVTLLEGQFNLSYAPSMNTVAWFDEDQLYVTLNIHFTFDYLQKFAAHFPLLDTLLKKAALGVASMMSRQHGQTTLEMSVLIKKILNCRYEGDIRNLYLEAKVQELLLLALEQLGVAEAMTGDIMLRPDDIERIRRAHDYLSEHIDESCTLKELARKVGTNDFKLKRGFKKLYGTTVYDFLIDARMEKAKTLLLETDTSVHDIAFITGYKNISGFITAFKKKTGYSPGHFKKMRKI